MLWAWAGVPLGVYTIIEQFNVALQIQPQMLTFLSLVTWIQCYYYEHKWSVPKALAVVIPIGCIMAGIEVGLISRGASSLLGYLSASDRQRHLVLLRWP
jgi:hypothetical protein